jgi:hypothetical protein
LIHDDSRQWNIEVLNKFFYSNVEEILKIKLPSRGNEDIVAWHYEKTGCFSVRSAYRLGMDGKEAERRTSSSSYTSGDRPVWKKLWSLPIPPKVKVFAWKLAHNGLATQANKTARKMERKSTCQLCGGDEDAHHAVLMCPHARMLRSAMIEFWELPEEQELLQAGFECLLWVVDNNDPEMMGKLMLILWRCWFVHNELTHSGLVDSSLVG